MTWQMCLKSFNHSKATLVDNPKYEIIMQRNKNDLEMKLNYFANKNVKKVEE